MRKKTRKSKPRVKIPADQKPNQAIRKALKDKNLTQRDFARAVGASDYQISILLNKGELTQDWQNILLAAIEQIPKKAD